MKPPRRLEILTKLREGPIRLGLGKSNNSLLSVYIHQLRELGYGIQLVKHYELTYEPETPDDKA